MRLCKPFRIGGQCAFVIASTVILTLISGALSGLYPNLKYLFGLAAFGFLGVGAAILYRYYLTEYEYCLEGDFFSVRKSVGFKGQTVFSLKLSKDVKLSTRKDEAKKLKCTSYRQNLSAATAFLVYEQAGKRLCVEFEPNVEFYGIVRDALDRLSDSQ